MYLWNCVLKQNIISYSKFWSCSPVYTVNLLGIDINYQLNFDTHIGNICRKASLQQNILKRLGSYLNKLSKLTIFHTFILSNFNFCPLAWHFCIQKIILKTWKGAGESTWFCVWSPLKLLDKAKMPSLHTRRQRTMAIETFKIINKITPISLQDLLHSKNSKYNFR